MSPGSRRAGVVDVAVICAVVLALAALLSGCGALAKVGAGSHNPPATQFTVPGRVTAVDISGGGGSVDVTASSRSGVSVSQQATYTSTAPTATHTLNGTTLSLSYHCPAELICSLSYDVQVPLGVAVSVSTSAGAVTLTSVSGAVTVRADAGLITAVDLRSPTASFTSNAGGVIAAFSAAPRTVTASTNVGPITLTLPGTTSYQVHTHTLLGTSSVSVPQSASAAHSVSASSDVGTVSVDAA
jgi:hypothetical protein